jgi:ATP-dependent Clp protease ATP-binding subunit ClpB
LKQVLQRALQIPLAGLILEGKVLDGEEVHVSAGPDGLTAKGKAVVAEATRRRRTLTRAPLVDGNEIRPSGVCRLR